MLINPFPKPEEEIFPHKVFKMMLSKGKIKADLVRMLLSWRHSGFAAMCCHVPNKGELMVRY
jgi:hypothetical protein